MASGETIRPAQGKGAPLTGPAGLTTRRRVSNICMMTQINKQEDASPPMRRGKPTSERNPSEQTPPSPKLALACCWPIDQLLAPRLFKALGDPTRATLLACLAKCGRACSVGEVAECCSVDFSVVSRHLALLAQCGILEADKKGRTVFYRVCYRELSGALRALADAIDECCPGDGEGCCGNE